MLPRYPKFILRILGLHALLSCAKLALDISSLTCLAHLFSEWLPIQNRTEETSISGLESCKSSPRPISAGPLHALPRFHSQPIYLVFFQGPYRLSPENSHLGTGFTLRCFQRFPLPDAAAQLHGWRHDWFTVGPSTPVLSY